MQAERQTLLKVKANLLTLEKAALSKKTTSRGKKGKSDFLKKSLVKKYALRARKELVASSGELNKLIARLQEKLVLGKGLSIVDKRKTPISRSRKSIEQIWETSGPQIRYIYRQQWD